MKNPKVGEKCAVYDELGVRLDGEIVAVDKDICEVDFDDICGTYHRTHLIRLKPRKKPRIIEFTCDWYQDCDGPYPGALDKTFPDKFFDGMRTKVTLEVIE